LNDQSLGVKGLFSILLTASLLFLGGFVVYVKLQDRYGSQERRKRRDGGGNFLDKLRDLISS